MSDAVALKVVAHPVPGTKHPWMKWWPDHWRSDPQLRTCSLPARGLWIELIGLMRSANLRGQLRDRWSLAADDEKPVPLRDVHQPA